VGLERIEIEQAEICRLHNIHFKCLGIHASSQQQGRNQQAYRSGANGRRPPVIELRCAILTPPESLCCYGPGYYAAASAMQARLPNGRRACIEQMTMRKTEPCTTSWEAAQRHSA
jgi:hypothetical protein